MLNAQLAKDVAMQRSSFGVKAYAVWKTLGISLPTVIDAQLRRVTKEKSDARLSHWSRSVIGGTPAWS